MATADGTTIECPSCHLDTPRGPRCEICGAPLPAMPPPGPSDDIQPPPPGPEPEPEAEQADVAEPPSAPKLEPMPESDGDGLGSGPEPDPTPPPAPPAPPPPAPPAPPPPAPPRPAPPPPFPPPPLPPQPPAGADYRAMMSRLVTDYRFEGRMARDDYWKMFALRVAVVVLAGLLAAGEGGGEMEMAAENDPLTLIAGIVMIVIGISGLAESCRRLHDTGRSGWWNLLALIPWLGWAGLVYLLAQPGEPGANAFGPPPDAPASP